WPSISAVSSRIPRSGRNAGSGPSITDSAWLPSLSRIALQNTKSGPWTTSQATAAPVGSSGQFSSAACADPWLDHSRPATSRKIVLIGNSSRWRRDHEVAVLHGGSAVPQRRRGYHVPQGGRSPFPSPL